MSDKTEQLSKEAGVSKGIAHALLLKNSWDNQKAMKALLDPSYIEKTFNFSGKDQEPQEDESKEFMCECCYCECDKATEGIAMEDCGHMLCTDCFPMYAQSKVMGADGVYALCPDKKCQLIVPPETFRKCLTGQEYERYEQFLLKSYVDLSYNAKHCPGGGC